MSSICTEKRAIEIIHTVGKPSSAGYDRKVPEYTEFLREIQPRQWIVIYFIPILLALVNAWYCKDDLDSSLCSR